MPKVRWVMSCGFCSKYIRFPAVQKYWKPVKIWQSYGEFKGGNFFETQCRKSHHWVIDYVPQLHFTTVCSCWSMFCWLKATVLTSWCNAVTSCACCNVFTSWCNAATAFIKIAMSLCSSLSIFFFDLPSTLWEDTITSSSNNHLVFMVICNIHNKKIC